MHQPSMSDLQGHKPQSALVACGVSLSNAAHASQSPQSNTPRAVTFMDVSELVGTTHTSIC